MCAFCHPVIPTKLQTSFRLPKQLASLTLWWSVFPTEEHGDLPLVPEFTAVQLEHLSANTDSHPLS